ncbi:hypothetical protein ZWY2020_030187 [Hordeum vulgare]|nr:hypothetical protein ZWY2020_030187 [Hordeum vulgare]
MAGGEEAQLGGFLDYMDVLRNYERSGVPRGAGTDSGDGFDLGRMRRLLRRLGDPHTHYPSVHIAGTKGKGSTAAFLSNIMRSKGTMWAAIQVFTALSFLLFSRENVDVAIVEAGLGGARDATNVIRNTELAAAIITTVGKEHLAALGGSLQSIAITKSGIIKEGRPVVIGGPFSTDIEQIIRDRAFLTQSPVISACDTGVRSITRCIGRDYAKPYQGCDIVVKISGDMPLSVELHDVKLQLLGDHQRQNAVLTSCTALCLRELAHTEASAKALSDVIKTVEPEGPVALIVGMASDKEHLALSCTTSLRQGGG